MKNYRSTDHFPKFFGGFTKGWMFVLPEGFKSAFDISFETYWKNKMPCRIETQGYNFHFKAGDTIYDCKEAYTLPWGKALKQVQCFLQVIEGEPADVDIKTGRVFNSGKVLFDVYRVLNSSRIVKVNRQTATQSEFIFYLSFGLILKGGGLYDPVLKKAV